MTDTAQRVVTLIGGPNGAGKTTIAPALLGTYLDLGPYVNADVLAQGLSGLRPEMEAFAAGRLMLEHLRRLAAAGRSFAFETTLASRTFAPWLRELIGSGYRFHLIYLWVDDVEIAIQRVAARVRAGGHAVAEADIRRRYHRGLLNFFNLYAPMATSWDVYDTSGTSSPIPIAGGETTEQVSIINAARWARMNEALKDD